jgi:hypothetical protein
MNRWLRVHRKGEPRGLTEEEMEDLSERLNSFVNEYRSIEEIQYAKDWEADDDS